MRVLERCLNPNGKTGMITVDEMPAGIQSGDALVEPFPDLVFHEPVPFDVEAAARALADSISTEGEK